MDSGACPVDDGHYPFVRKVQYSYDVIRKYLHLRGHCQEFQSIFRTRHFASLEIHNYFNENGFFLVHTPIVSSNSCEGAGEVKLVNYFFGQAQFSLLILRFSKCLAFFHPTSKYRTACRNE